MHRALQTLFSGLLMWSSAWAVDVASWCQVDATSSTVPVDAFSKEWLEIFGWLPDSADRPCCGHFQSLLTPPSLEPNLYRFAADSESALSREHISYMTGHVVIDVDQRTLIAEKVCLRPEENKPDGRGKTVIPHQGMTIYTPTAAIWAETGSFDVEHRALDASTVAYRLREPKPPATLAAWGTAEEVHQANPDDRWHLKKASYSSCSPDQTTWRLWANRLDIDEKDKTAYAYNAVWKLHGIPFFYMPFVEFPITNERRSGFLMPTFTSSGDDGFTVKMPYYWNLAPNYDLLTTPIYMSKRKLGLDTRYRWLSDAGLTYLRGLVYFNDPVFKDFRDSTVDANPGLVDTDKAYGDLADDSTRRWALDGHYEARNMPVGWHLGAHWKWASDDYLLTDAHNPFGYSDLFHLDSEVRLNYRDAQQSAALQFLYFQTLHPVNESSVDDLYSRLPSVSWRRHWSLPSSWQGSVRTQVIDFVHPDDYNSDDPMINAWRFVLQPEVQRAFTRASGQYRYYANLHWVGYQTDDDADDVNEGGTSEGVPNMGLDAYWLNHVRSADGKRFFTIKPEIFYHYVPYQDQSNLHLYDTVLPKFDVNQLFVHNRFAGDDLVGDANEVTYALTVSVPPTSKGRYWSTTVGQRYAFKEHKVCADDDCEGDINARHHLSPWAQSALYHWDKMWSISEDLTWYQAGSRVQNADVFFNYHKNPWDVSLGYGYVRDVYDDSDQDDQEAVNQYVTRIHWQVNNHLAAHYNWTYDAEENYTVSQNVALRYASCCWALGLTFSRYDDGVGSGGDREYDDRIMFSFELLGLTSRPFVQQYGLA